MTFSQNPSSMIKKTKNLRFTQSLRISVADEVPLVNFTIGKFTKSIQRYRARQEMLLKEHGYLVEVLKCFVNISFMNQLFIKRLYKCRLIRLGGVYPGDLHFRVLRYFPKKFHDRFYRRFCRYDSYHLMWSDMI